MAQRLVIRTNVRTLFRREPINQMGGPKLRKFLQTKKMTCASTHATFFLFLSNIHLKLNT